LADQQVLVQNFDAKIQANGPALGLTPTQVSSAQDLCASILSAFQITEQCKQTMQAVTNWRDLVFYGSPKGEAITSGPVFPVIGVVAFTRGAVTQFMELRDLIVALPGYTVAIGEDLGIIGPDTPSPEGTIAPDLKATVAPGYTVNLSGSMRGMSGMRIEYSRAGGPFVPVAFFTNTPGSFQITPAAPGEPETGNLRAVYIKKNAEFGAYSPNYPVTLS
jgi:hypothetical protein